VFWCFLTGVQVELPFFKAFPMDWEVTMMRAGIPASHRNVIYRLIFFAWQQGGLMLDENVPNFDRKIHTFAKAFGMPYSRLKPYLDSYKEISERDANGQWLPSFLVQQFVHATNSQAAKREQNSGKVETDSRRIETENEQLPAEPQQLSAETEQKQSRNGADLEQKNAVSPLPATPSLAEARAEARAGAESAHEGAQAAPLSAPLPATANPLAEIADSKPATPESLPAAAGARSAAGSRSAPPITPP
jgi:hypothetical protein